MYDFITKPLFRPFFLIGNSVHGSLPLTFDTSNDLERESYHQEKIKNNSRFLFIGENKMVTHSKKIRLSKAATVTLTIVVLKFLILSYDFYLVCSHQTVNTHITKTKTQLICIHVWI